MFLFDMDGTLIDSNGIWKNVDREFLARRGLPYTHAYYEGVAHTIFPLAAKFTKEFCNLPEKSCAPVPASVSTMRRRPGTSPGDSGWKRRNHNVFI